VTHDVDEAIFLSDRIVVLSERPGRVKADLTVDLPRPRTRDLLTSIEFMRLKREALALLFDGPEPGGLGYRGRTGASSGRTLDLQSVVS
ncbi:MAG TPA: hypothetical protein VMG12_40910, partial [Polyangiaceae bacterium]|nr:hypothetical protein [Polyangiaceae bacterium]